MVGHAQLLVGAEHAHRGLSAERSCGDVDSAGEGGAVLGHGHQVALPDVLCAGDDLYRGGPADVHLTDPHVVGIGVTDQGENLAHHYVFDLGALHLGDLHLGAGECHGLGKVAVGGRDGGEFVQPFTG